MFIALAKLHSKDDEYYPFQICIVAKSKAQLKRVMITKGLDKSNYNVYDAEKVVF